MKIVQMKNSLWLLFMISFAVCCSTVGDEIIRPRLGNIAFIPTVADPLVYRISLNNEVVIENITGQTVFPYKRRSDTLRLKIVDVVNNRVIFDSLFKYHPYSGAGNSLISLFQKRPGSAPFYVRPSIHEPLPPAGYNKISFAYNYPDFPDSVKAVVEDVLPGQLTYAAVDSFYLRKNEFSRFFLSARRGVGENVRVKLYSPDISRQLLGNISTFQYLVNEANMFMYLANQRESSATQLRLNKVY